MICFSRELPKLPRCGSFEHSICIKAISATIVMPPEWYEIRSVKGCEKWLTECLEIEAASSLKRKFSEMMIYSQRSPPYGNRHRTAPSDSSCVFNLNANPVGCLLTVRPTPFTQDEIAMQKRSSGIPSEHSYNS